MDEERGMKKRAFHRSRAVAGTCLRGAAALVLLLVIGFVGGAVWHQWQLVPEEPPTVYPLCPRAGRKMYGAFDGPCEVCGMEEAEVMSMLNETFECGFGAEKRSLFLQGSWQFWNTSDLNAKAEKGPPLCGVYCVLAGHTHRNQTLNGTLVPVWMRPGSSDFYVGRQIFVEGQLDVVHAGQQFKTILDAGANVGLASVFFATLFPKATIVALEPSTANYRQLKRNVQRFPNVYPIHAALWPTNEKLALVNHHEEWGYRAMSFNMLHGEETIGTMQGVSIPFLLEIFGFKGFDFIKMDIEGSEHEVFAKEHRKGWQKFLKHGKLAVLEVHDWWVPNSSVVVDYAFDSMKRWRKEGTHDEHTIYRSIDT